MSFREEGRRDERVGGAADGEDEGGIIGMVAENADVVDEDEEVEVEVDEGVDEEVGSDGDD